MPLVVQLSLSGRARGRGTLTPLPRLWAGTEDRGRVQPCPRSSRTSGRTWCCMLREGSRHLRASGGVWGSRRDGTLSPTEKVPVWEWGVWWRQGAWEPK